LCPLSCFLSCPCKAASCALCLYRSLLCPLLCMAGLPGVPPVLYGSAACAPCKAASCALCLYRSLLCPLLCMAGLPHVPLSVRQVFNVESLSCNLAFRAAVRERELPLYLAQLSCIFSPLLSIFPLSSSVLCHQISFIHMSLCLSILFLDFPLFCYRNRIRTPKQLFFGSGSYKYRIFSYLASEPLFNPSPPPDSATYRYYLIRVIIFSHPYCSE
jgi:hypothetical protein